MAEEFGKNRNTGTDEDLLRLDNEEYPAKREDLSGLRDFAARLSCDRLIVHCWEGVSRSGAVAKAVFEFRGETDELIAGRDLSPNPLVYSLARRELGIR